MLIKEGTFTNQSPPSYQQYQNQRPIVENVPLHLADLQSVSESVLTAAKNEMSSKFEENIVTSEHPDYVYDKRVEFDVEEAEPSEWDD